jgi:quinol monooxygenase YgiN
MAAVWTYGKWTVAEGREDEFVRLWAGLRDVGRALGGSDPILLRDREQPNIFHSFGSWPDVETIERFRAADEFAQTITSLRPLLVDFEPRTLDEVLRGE